MRKLRCVIGMIGSLLGACSSQQETQPSASAPSPAVATPAAAVPAAANGRFMVQVGAIGDAQSAASWQQSLSQRFSVPGRVAANGNLYRVQLGPFQSRQQAQALVQRLQSEAQQSALLPPSSGRNAFLAGAPFPGDAGRLSTCPRPV